MRSEDEDRLHGTSNQHGACWIKWHPDRVKEQTSKRANEQTSKRANEGVQGGGGCIACGQWQQAQENTHVLCQDGWFVEHHELFGCVLSGDTNQRLLPARMFAEELQPIMFIAFFFFPISQREDQVQHQRGKLEIDFFK